MQPSERYDIILQKLSSQEMITIPELMSTFDVSIETVRRDLNHLEKKHLIKKVYGGAILFNRPVSSTNSDLRLREHPAEKEAIGRECAKLVNDGDTLFLGPGTTVQQVARHLRNHKKLTVLTDSLYVVMELLNTDTDLYFIGGSIEHAGAHVSAQIPPGAWDFFIPTKAIIGVSGISPTYGITDFRLREAGMIKSILSRSGSVIVVADNSKFGRVGTCTTCSLSRVNRIVTGSYKQEEILKDFSAYRHRFIFVNYYPPEEVPAESASTQLCHT